MGLFEPDSGPVQGGGFEIRATRKQPRAGDPVPVRYDPDEPISRVGEGVLLAASRTFRRDRDQPGVGQLVSSV